MNIGVIVCQVISVASQTIVCKLPNLNLGAQTVTVLIDGNFQVFSKIFFIILETSFSTTLCN